jgi:hypothetical protein
MKPGTECCTRGKKDNGTRFRIQSKLREMKVQREHINLKAVDSGRKRKNNGIRRHNHINRSQFYAY